MMMLWVGLALRCVLPFDWLSTAKEKCAGGLVDHKRWNYPFHVLVGGALSVVQGGQARDMAWLDSARVGISTSPQVPVSNLPRCQVTDQYSRYTRYLASACGNY